MHLTGKTDQFLIKALLERAKGSLLDIIANYYKSPARDVTLLSPFAQQIRSLYLERISSDQVQEFSETISGPLPLLHALKIDAVKYWGGPNSLVAPTLPLFKNAVNLGRVVLCIDEFPSLQHFNFPHLTNFKLTTYVGTFPVSRLLNLLEASPVLRRIEIAINTRLLQEGVPPERAVVLPCVKTFCLWIVNDRPDCEVATHISCPSAKSATFEHWMECAGIQIPRDIYPPPAPWNTIVRQFTNDTVERVVLETTIDEELHIKCSIIFGSSDGTTLNLCYAHHGTEEDGEMERNLNERLPEVFAQASRAIKNYSLLANIRDLYIRGGDLVTANLELTTKDVGQLLGSMGPLEKLTLDGCDLRPYLDPFLDVPLFPEGIQPVSFPPIKKFVIIKPVQSFRDDEVYAAAIVKLTRSQHARGVHFDLVEFQTIVPSPVVDELAFFVGGVEYYDEMLSDGDEYQDHCLPEEDEPCSVPLLACHYIERCTLAVCYMLCLVIVRSAESRPF